MKCRRAIATTIVLAVTVAALQARAQDAAPGASGAAGAVMAVWVEQKADFPYKGFTAYYSCEGIRSKVKRILQAIGARPGFKVDVRGCVNDTLARPGVPGVENMPWVYIQAALPQPATPELLAELAKPDPKKELVSRVQGKSATATAEATAQFPARPRQVRLTGSPVGPVQLGDCELVDQMADGIFQELGAKVVENQNACVPRQVNPGSIRLTLEVLEPVPPPDTPAP